MAYSRSTVSIQYHCVNFSNSRSCGTLSRKPVNIDRAMWFRPNSYSEEKGDTIKSLAIVLSQSDIDERRTELPNWKILQGRLDGHPEPVRGLLLFHHLPCSGRPCHYCAAKHSNGWIRIDGRSPDEICRQSSATTCSFQNYLCTTDNQTPCYFLHLLLHSHVSALQLSPG